MKFLLGLIFLSFNFSALAQTDSVPFKYNHWEPNFKKYTKMKRQQSLYCIETLKDGGALLVRLKTSQRKIEALRDAGYTSDANKIEQEQLDYNKSIVKAFQQHYDFSKLYFFFSTDSEAIRNGETKGLFLNSELQVDPDIELTENFYLIAEFDNVEFDPIGFPSKEELQNVALRPSVMNYNSLVVRDKYFIQLRKPFPYYVSAPEVERVNAYVDMLNSNFNLFYEKRHDINLFSPTITLFWFSKKTDKVEHYYED